MAGAIAGSMEDYDKLWFTRQAIGTTLDAYSASLLERGLKTFSLRAERMASNAMAVAEHLARVPDVSNVRYPGLKGFDGHELAAAQMKHGFGGMLAFDVGETQEDAKRFISALQVIYHAVSLGSTESLICIPFLTTMLYMPPERRTGFGVRPNTVRLSVGIELAPDLLADIDQALEQAQAGQETCSECERR
jgi:cystathionine gamma-synthase